MVLVERGFGSVDVKKLIEKYNMQPHEENGNYSECHYPYEGEGRAPSGSSYFYTSPGEKTLFHKIDCDEYWVFNAGSSVAIWIIDDEGRLTIKKMGWEEDADPVVYISKGSIFGSKNLDSKGDGTFFTCITVPRFDYKGFELIDKNSVIRLCPAAKEFFV